MNVWIDIAVVALIFAVGGIFFGHFEERTPKWRRVLKLVVMVGVAAILSRTGGHLWSAAFIAAVAALGLTAHFWWLRKHGIDPFTAEPKDKYYALRGWKA